MTSILMSIILMIGIVMIGCTNQPPPIPVPPATSTPMIMVDERLMVMDALTKFNTSNNNFVLFLNATNDIYDLGNTMIQAVNVYHVGYVHSTLIVAGLNVYNDAIINWTPPEKSSYYDRLIELKEAELYRIEYFGELNSHMLIALPTENEEAIRVVLEEFNAWREDSLNRKPIELQDVIIKELNINPDDIDFMYIVSDKPLPTLPPIFDEGENRSLWKN